MNTSTHFHRPCELLDMIRVEPMAFALPFALVGALGAAQGLPAPRSLLWILAAMVGARIAVMIFNRLVNESGNPRTCPRALPAGHAGRSAAWGMFGCAIILFGFSAGMLGPLPWLLAPFALVVLLGYSLCKRLAPWSHLVLGLVLGGAPLGAWIAVAGRPDPPVWTLASGVLAWTAGFDILYGLQDESFDRARERHPVPSRFGARPSLWISRSLHILALAAWAAFNLQMRAHLLPWLAWSAVGGILFREQWVVRDGGLDHIDRAFFMMNNLVGPIFLLGYLLEWFQRLAFG